MNILIISNNAPEYYRFFNKLATALNQGGNEVCFAVDTHYSRELNKLDENGFRVYTFSDFWAEMDVIAYKEAASQLKGTACNIMHLPDYERAEAFKFNVKRDFEYYDRLLAALNCYFEKLYRKEKIDVVIYENVSNTFAYAAWYVARRMSVKYIGLYVSRLPGRFEIVDDPLGESRIYGDIFFKIRSNSIKVSDGVMKYTKKYLSEFDEIQPDYMKFNDLASSSLLNYMTKSKIRKLFYAFKRVADDHNLSFGAGNPLLLAIEMFKRKMLRTVRSEFSIKYFTEPKEGECYFLYPLHYHPESSTSVKSPFLIDELTVVRNLSMSLPYGMKLYVKDHPSAFGLQSIEFYKRVSRLPNVRLIHHQFNTRKLIKASAAVITQTSTVGYEALFYGKRVFLMGADAYEYHPNVVKMNDPALYFQQLSCWAEGSLADDQLNEDFVAAYFMGTYEGILNFNQSDNNLSVLADQVYNAIKTRLQ